MIFRTTKNFVKYLWRTGSFQIACEQAGFKAIAPGIKQYKWKGITVYHSGDHSEMMEYYYKPRPKYWVHPDLKPKTILDIGASNGVTAGFFRWYFPEARIICVEPQQNETLLKNIESYGNAEAHFISLGDHNGNAELKGTSDAPGSCTIYMDSPNPNFVKIVPIKTIDTFLNELRLDDIDLIKIDCEGAEYAILKAMSPDRLAKVKWIVGELHGFRDFELLDYLAQQGFDIDGRKSLTACCWKFHAVRPSVLLRLKKYWRIKWLQW